MTNDSQKQIDVINDSEELIDAISDPSSDPKVATYTTNGNFTQKLLSSRFVPNITPFFIVPINLLVTANVVGVQDILSPCQTVLPKARVTNAALSCAHIFRNPWKVSCTGRDDSTSRDVNSDENSKLS